MTKNNIIYKESDPVKYMYFLKSGEVEISKLVNINEYLH